MKIHLYIKLGLLSIVLFRLPATAQRKVVSELTLVYEYNASSDAHGKPEASENAIHTVYIKGNKSRSEMASALFSSTTIFDANTGSAVILREVNGQKLLIRLNPENWLEKNRNYDGIVFRNTNETKIIAGYPCTRAIGQTASGAVITVYYTRDLVPENRQYDPVFRTLDGLPLEYELSNGNVRIHYKMSRISLNPVPASKFDIPSAGYREMNYEESKKMKEGR
ncbi:MAG TPA: hypothetical protein VHE54_06520 [Puia sp.]|nr:hypothetical protein [Puia sp.]